MLRRPPDDDNWEAAEPAPEELEDWDESLDDDLLDDEDYEDCSDDESDEWPDDEWPDLDHRFNDDEEDDA